MHVYYITPKRDVFSGLFKFWELSDNISLIVQDKDIVVMEH